MSHNKIKSKFVQFQSFDNKLTQILGNNVNPLLNHLPDHHAWLTFSVRSLDITKIKMKFEMILWQLNITNKADKSLTMFQSSKNSNSSMLKICNIKQAKCTKAAKNAGVFLNHIPTNGARVKDITHTKKRTAEFSR